jgi:glycosyltransferase involved in cell wall biosynthesis
MKKRDAKKTVYNAHTHPFVSVITPTYNRTQFLEGLVECYKSQDYPKERMEWIMFDDGTDKAEEKFLALTKGLPNIRYIYDPVKVNIGAKRNRLNKEAKGEIIIAMDDDDFYPPERVRHVVHSFRGHPKIELAGSSQVFMYYKDNFEIIRLGPYGPNHATNGTMAWRRSYARTHTYDETVKCAEEKSFLENYIHPMIQLDPFKTMLVMSHSQNTFNKDMFREQGNNEIIRKTQMKIKDFIKDKRIRDIFLVDHKSLVPVEGKNIKASSFRQPLPNGGQAPPQIDPQILEQLDPELRAKILAQLAQQQAGPSQVQAGPNQPKQIRITPEMAALMDPELFQKMTNPSQPFQLTPEVISKMHPEVREKIFAQLAPQPMSPPQPQSPPAPLPSLDEIDPKILEQMDPEFRAKILSQLAPASNAPPPAKEFHLSV